MDLIGLSKYCGNLNLPGLEKIEYAPVDWVDSFEELISDDHYLKQPITFTTGSWLTAPVFPIQMEWSENQQNTQQGTAYEQQVTATFPRMRPAVSGEFAMMTDRPFILKLTDPKGEEWIVGTKESGLLFQAPAKTGTAGSTNLNDYQIQFFGMTATRAYGYAPVL